MASPLRVMQVKSFRFINIEKFNTFAVKVSNDNCLKILSFVITKWTEKLATNFSFDICSKSFRFISIEKSDTFVVNVINDYCLKILSLVITEWTEKLAPNFSFDICSKSFRFQTIITADLSYKCIRFLNDLTYCFIEIYLFIC